MPNQSFVVAVVDDEDILREALGGLLAAQGYETELYGSAEDFLAAVADTKADCLLVDVHLGGACGIELGCKPFTPPALTEALSAAARRTASH